MKQFDNAVKILHEERHFIVAYKPPQMLTQHEEGRASVELILKGILQKKEGKERPFLHAVHRLDKPVSGLVLFAKSSKALSRLNASLREGKWEKIYRLSVEGTLQHKEGIMEDALLKEEFHSTPSEGGKYACLFYKVIKEEKGRSIIDVELKTGRYHQIRVQFAHRGFPIVGDTKYGSKIFHYGIDLCHYSLAFPHPITGDTVSIIVD